VDDSLTSNFRRSKSGGQFSIFPGDQLSPVENIVSPATDTRSLDIPTSSAVDELIGELLTDRILAGGTGEAMRETLKDGGETSDETPCSCISETNRDELDRKFGFWKHQRKLTYCPVLNMSHTLCKENVNSGSQLI